MGRKQAREGRYLTEKDGGGGCVLGLDWGSPGPLNSRGRIRKWKGGAKGSGIKRDPAARGLQSAIFCP